MLNRAAVLAGGVCFAFVAFAGDLPDHNKTPGAAFPVTKEQICQSGYTACVRHVTASTSKAIYASYGIKRHKKGEYEVDHLISLEIGGSNDPENLWPQSYVTQPRNAHVKDWLENKLNELVCTDKMSLQQAQHLIASNWIKAFDTYGGRVQPMKHPKHISKTECSQLHERFVTNQ